jgi:hypothetical protein
MKLYILPPVYLACTSLLLVGCNKQTDEIAQGWSVPTKVTESKDSLIDGVNLYKWHSTIIALQGLDDRSARCFLMNSATNSWTEAQLTGVPRGYFWAEPEIDQTSDMVLFEQGYMENDQLVMNALIGHMSGRIAVQDVVERKWLTDKKSLFGETAPNVRLNEPGKRGWPSLGIGIINGPNLYIPYCLCGSILTIFTNGATSLESGSFNNGVFHSTDSGMTWQLERLSDSNDWLPSMSRTKGYYYYFAVSLPTKPGQEWELWFARKSVDGNSWDSPKVITKTFCDNALCWKYINQPQEDMVHLCWLDRRHEKRRFNFGGEAKRQNYEVAYCQRKDSDANWSEDVILSKGMLYSYSPSMSVEGDKIVVAWAGVRTAADWHAPYSPNDIYYVTSKDGGKSWTEPLRVTDNIKAGVTAGDPQVVLLNGIIHMSYIQGKLNLKQESPGLTKLNQPPWPIYYTQRPFPD